MEGAQLILKYKRSTIAADGPAWLFGHDGAYP
jgi:hypothetical protein